MKAFIQGDRNAQKPLWSERDDVTLANPFGPPAKGYDQACQVIDSASALTSEGEGYTFDTISVVETPDLACHVGIEHSMAKLGDAAAKVPITLRLTKVFRREDDGWKIVHRHADPITAARPVQSVIQQSRDTP